MAKTNKFGLLLFPALLSLGVLTGCGDNGSSRGGKDPYGILPELSYTGNLDIVVYIQGADGIIRDIGSNKIITSDLDDGNKQKYHAVAKEFNKIYPNIKVNLIFNSIDAYDNMIIDYQSSHDGHLPHIMHLPYTVQEGLARGWAADLKKYDYLKLYNAIDKDVFDFYTFGDFVAGVPFYIYPTGIFVNKTLLKNSYIETDNLLDNWTFEEMVNILSRVHNPSKSIGGTAVLSNDMIDIISGTINETLLNDRYIDLNTSEIEWLIEKEAEMAQYSVYDYKNNGIYSSFPEIKTWSYNTNFINDELYSMEMTRSYCAMLYSQMIENLGKVGNFDFMPFPKVNEDGDFRIGMIAEGLVVGNQCQLDAKGKEMCTKKDKAAEEAAAVFAFFMAADTRAVKSIATTKWVYQGEEIAGNYESLPVARKDLVLPTNEGKTETFDVENFVDENLENNDYQLQLSYYKNLLSSFAEEEGFQEVLRIFEEDMDNVYAYNTIPRNIPTETGGTKDILQNWNSRYRDHGSITSITWIERVKSYLSDWTTEVNENVDTAWSLLQENVDEYYGAGKYNILGI